MVVKTPVLMVAVAVCVAATVGAYFILDFSGDEKTAFVSVSTDNTSYRSREIMIITVSVDYPGYLNDTLVRVRGITNSRGLDLVDKEKNANLTPGANNINFSYTIPSCSKCSGISQGTYYINASVIQGNLTIGRANHTIVIEG